MENNFFILSRLGFILKVFCSPRNVFLSYYYFLFQHPGHGSLAARPSSSRLPQALPGSPRASPWLDWGQGGIWVDFGEAGTTLTHAPGVRMT